MPPSHSSTRAASSPPVSAAASGEQRAHQEQQQLSDASKEASKQLALLLVEVVSPDVMYNGLPWPDEDFIKVVNGRVDYLCDSNLDFPCQNC